MSSPRGSVLRPIEIASGLVFGSEEPGPAVSALPPSAIRTHLEDAVLPALQRAPCLVSFSGGRDSSSVLALVAHVARREGLPAPVPATLRFPGLSESDESDWQERVVRHLGLEDWIRLEPGSDLDVVGPIATDVLERHGLLWPFNAYVHQPLFEHARGGSLLTGFGGDEIFDSMRPDRIHAILARRVTPVPRDALRVGLAVSPWRVRRTVLQRRSALILPWLTTSGQTALTDSWATDEAREPRRLAARASWWSRRRALRVALRSLTELAAAENVLSRSPLASPELAVSIHADSRLAFADRAGRLQAVFGDLLPEAIYERRSKASFNRAFYGPHARSFVERWQGDGVDDTLVDRDALRRAWHDPVPDGRTFTLLQHAWLVTQASRRGASLQPPATTTSEGDAAPTQVEQPG